MGKPNNIDLKECTLVELNELLNRQLAILKNRKLLSALEDRGEAIKRLHDRIKTEIDYRKNMESLEMSMKQLDLTSKDDQTTEDKSTRYRLTKEQPVDLTVLPFMLRTKTHPNRTTPTDSTLKLVYLPLAESLEAETKSYYTKLEQKVRQSFGNLVDSGDECYDDDDDTDNEN